MGWSAEGRDKCRETMRGRTNAHWPAQHTQRSALQRVGRRCASGQGAPSGNNR